MNRNELKQHIIDVGALSYNETQIYVRPSRVLNILSELEISTINCRSDLSERIYWIINDIYDYPFCITCGKQFFPRFYGHKHGYRNSKSCSIKCNNKSEYHKNSITISYYNKTGYKYNTQNPEHQEKLKLIHQKKYGVIHPFQSDEVKTKIKATNQIRYGVDNTAQDPIISAKSQRYRTKHMILSSGKVISYQGYEDVALALLFQHYREDEIKSERIDVPRIWYMELDKKKVYFPDIFIPKENLIIEVKSEWTYQKYLDKNLLKRQSSIDAGYNFEFWICNNKQLLYKQ